jgi:hypothetical protein
MRFKGGVGISAEKRVVGIDIISKEEEEMAFFKVISVACFYSIPLREGFL